MSRIEKTREKLLLGKSDANIDFGELRSFLLDLGFTERVKGSHHIYSRSKIEEIINIQPKGGNAKPYQVKQIRNIILKYRLGVTDE
jgi:predicted RNA binding protein YcfA (HicA-like mRNA interferase family)